MSVLFFVVFFSSRRRHTRYWRDWSSDVCSSDLEELSPADISDYLSGLMIGAEIDEVIGEYNSPDKHVTLIGAPALCQRYSLALFEAGMTSTVADNAGIAAFQAL